MFFLIFLFYFLVVLCSSTVLLYASWLTIHSWLCRSIDALTYAVITQKKQQLQRPPSIPLLATRGWAHIIVARTAVENKHKAMYEARPILYYLWPNRPQRGSLSRMILLKSDPHLDWLGLACEPISTSRRRRSISRISVYRHSLAGQTSWRF